MLFEMTQLRDVSVTFNIHIQVDITRRVAEHM